MTSNKFLLAGIYLAGCVSTGTSWAQLNLGLDFANTNQTSVPLTSGTSIDVQPGGLPVINAITDEVVVCLDRSGASTGAYQLNLVDPNDQD